MWSSYAFLATLTRRSRSSFPYHAARSTNTFWRCIAKRAPPASWSSSRSTSPQQSISGVSRAHRRMPRLPLGSPRAHHGSIGNLGQPPEDRPRSKMMRALGSDPTSPRSPWGTRPHHIPIGEQSAGRRLRALLPHSSPRPLGALLRKVGRASGSSIPLHLTPLLAHPEVYFPRFAT